MRGWARLHRPNGHGAMGHFHYSKGFGVPLAAALGLMLARRALAQSAAPNLWLASYKLALAPSASSDRASLRNSPSRGSPRLQRWMAGLPLVTATLRSGGV